MNAEDDSISPVVFDSFEREPRAFIAANRRLTINLAFGVLLDLSRRVGITGHGL